MSKEEITVNAQELVDILTQTIESNADTIREIDLELAKLKSQKTILTSSNLDIRNAIHNSKITVER
jgi:hypothetical protein